MNAIEKLNGERAKANTAEGKVIDYLVKRCKEDRALCEDVMNAKKSFKNCVSYYTSKAREEAKKQSSSGAVCIQIDDEVVYEWAEDYFHKQNLDIDNPKPKTEAPKTAAKKAEIVKFDKDKAIAKATAKKPEKPTFKASQSQPKAVAKPTPKPAPKTPSIKVDDDGQLNLFGF